MTRTTTISILVSAAVLTLPACGRKPAVSPGATPEVIAAKKERAAGWIYPPTTGGASPESISVEFDAARDRTKMTLTLKPAATTPTGAALDGVTLRLVSEFLGQHRAEPELSVTARLTVVSRDAGVLAPASPPGAFEADGKELPVMAPAGGKSGYTSAAKPDGSHESLSFRVPTRDLLKLAKASKVNGRFGAMSLTLSAAQARDLREFIARMKPESQ